MNQAELAREREYTQMVQGLLYSVINASKGNAAFQEESIQTILNDAWEEMRLKPTALSQQDIDQLQTEINRYAARKSFSEGRAAQYECMLANPFFARVDFTEEPDGTQETPPEKEKIVIGLYSLKDAERRIVVHDWRAPICSLYYDCLPGPASYVCPDGTIRGVLSLKRQYAMDKGKLKYYVDTDYSIDDSMLLDILSGATSSHMRQIVATIQSEQNAAIRHDNARVLSVIGGAGSGKTSVAMHRAAYLMYRYRDQLSSECIAVISPSQAFSEYISQVLPSLGEKNTQSHTVHDILSKVIGRKIETPVAQYETLLSGVPELRHQSVAYKAGVQQRRKLLHDSLHAARVAELAYRVLSVRLDVDQQRRFVADAVEVHQVEVNARAPGDGLEVNEQVGAAAAGHEDADGVFDRVLRDDVAGADVVLHQAHDLPSGHFAHAQHFGGHCDAGCAAGQRQAERLGDRLAGIGGAHDGAGAGASVQAALVSDDLVHVDLAHAVARPEPEAVGAAAQRLTLVHAGQHCAAGQEDGGLVGRDGGHELGGNVLVAAADEHHPVEGMPGDQLLGGHGEQVAVDQAGQVEENLADRHRVDLEREAARRPHAPLDRLGELPEVYVAGVGFGPGIDDADDRLFDVLIGIAHGLEQGVSEQSLPGAALFPDGRGIVIHGGAPFG